MKMQNGMLMDEDVFINDDDFVWDGSAHVVSDMMQRCDGEDVKRFCVDASRVIVSGIRVMYWPSDAEFFSAIQDAGNDKFTMVRDSSVLIGFYVMRKNKPKDFPSRGIFWETIASCEFDIDVED